MDGENLSKFVDFFFQHLDRTAPAREALEEIKADSKVYVYHRPEDTDYALSLAKACSSGRSSQYCPPWRVTLPS